MNVKKLIEILSSLPQEADVIIEVNHDEILPVRLSNIELAMITPDYRLACDEDTVAESATIIRL